MNTKMLTAATALIGATLGMNQPAQAVTISKSMFIDPSTACQLSLPTFDTMVRPRATGYRNEGTAGTFVICGTAYFSAFSGTATSLQVQMTAFDGVAHANVSCTAVTRQSTGGAETFNTRIAASVPTTGTSISWEPGDLDNFSGFANSVTCNIPAGVAITGVRMVYPDDVGA
jgi:hypothetical protein